MPSLIPVAELLELPEPSALSSPVGFADRIDAGLPLEALDRLARMVAPGESVIIQSEFGSEAVVGIMGRLRFGTAA